MSEYCILGDNGGEINGNGRDMGIDPALYLARVIHNDLTIANASACIGGLPSLCIIARMV